MKDTFAVTQDQVDAAQDYEAERGVADLREPLSGDRCYYIGWSGRQEEYVLLSRDLDDNDNYTYACAAYNDLWQLIPTTFVVDGKVVAKLKTSFGIATATKPPKSRSQNCGSRPYFSWRWMPPPVVFAYV